MPVKKVSKQMQDLMQRMRDDGVPMKEIAKELGVDVKTVSINTVANKTCGIPNSLWEEWEKVTALFKNVVWVDEGGKDLLYAVHKRKAKAEAKV